MNYKIVSKDEDIITLDEVKEYLREDSNEEEVLSTIQSLIHAAIDYCEERIKKAIQIKTYDYFIDSIKSIRAHDYQGSSKYEVALPKPPLISVEYIKLRDVSGSGINLESDKYYVDIDSEPGKIIFKDIPSYNPIPSNSVVIRFKAGYEREILPMSIYQAILLLISHWYDNRAVVIIGNVSKQIEFSVDALLMPHKLYGW